MCVCVCMCGVCACVSEQQQLDDIHRRQRRAKDQINTGSSLLGGKDLD